MAATECTFCMLEEKKGSGDETEVNGQKRTNWKLSFGLSECYPSGYYFFLYL
jgi:hypothetical protein